MSEQDTPERAGPRKLPASLAAHPSVRAVLARRADGGGTPAPPPVIDADWLRALCREAGAADAAAVRLDHPDLAGEREHVLAALPGTRTLISLMVRMNRDNTRSGSTRPPAPWPGPCRTPATAHSTRRRASPRRWSASRAGSGWCPTRPWPWPPGWA
ncbi:hypothetical protein [Streptomyces cinerochromogenes]|uniref:hypothetical protein n=1 Tax=Streptomyces cinerochromogenes TaxID=66422 RepID=UPI0019A6A53E|nr:hypothetical protein [Streptomyces cinerochromogenes]GGS53507.1 hypothetical protein GCM10010206_13890 [Streptomyces cinerochromogenes]